MTPRRCFSAVIHESDVVLNQTNYLAQTIGNHPFAISASDYEISFNCEINLIDIHP